MSKYATKAQAVALKAAPTEEGTFEALVAVFGNVDAYGDVIVKGAFADTLKEWGESGHPIPVVWSHAKDDPFSHIGVVEEAKETDTGLLVTGRLDLDNPTAAQVHRLLKGGRVKEFSFAFSYDPEDVTPAKRDGVEVRELHRLKLHEVGPTMIGANPATELISVKSADIKADEEPAEETPAEEDNDVLEQVGEVVAEMSNLVERLNGILEQNLNPDSDDSEDDELPEAGAEGEASRSQASTDEAQQGKSGASSADRSAVDEKKFAELVSAVLMED